MAIATWVWIVIIVFTHIIHAIGGGFLTWFVHMRATGLWGGGKKTLDFQAYPQGQINEYRIQKNGSMYALPAGGDEVIITRVLGIWKTEHVRHKVSDVIPVGDYFFIGKKGIEKAFEVYLEDKDLQIVHYKNALSAIQNKLSKEIHTVEEAEDRRVKVLNDLAKALAFSRPDSKTSTQKKK